MDANIHHEGSSDEEIYEDRDYLELDSRPISTLVDGINLNDLIHKSEASFEVSSNFEDALEEQRNSYQYNDNLINHINLACLDIDSDDEDGNSLGAPCNTPFEKIALKMEKVNGNDKVQKRVLKVGTGEVVPPNAIVWVHYNAYIEYGDEPYDSTYLRGSPQKFRLGQEMVILGFDKVVGTMKKNEVAQALIHPDMGFGISGCPPRIPGNASLLFVVELLKFSDNFAAEEYAALSPEERKDLDFASILKAARAEHLIGNDLFKKGNTRSAIPRYKKAIRILEACHLADAEQERDQQEALCKLYVNLAVCFNKQQLPRLTCTMCKNALYIQPSNVKALFNYGKALLILSDFTQARRYLKQAQAYEPQNGDISSELKKLDIKSKAYHFKNTQFLQQMFKSCPKEEKVQVDKDSSVVTEDFKKAIQEYLLQLINNPEEKNTFSLPDSLTNNEEICFMEEAKNLGIDLKIQDTYGKKVYFIKKSKVEQSEI